MANEKIAEKLVLDTIKKFQPINIYQLKKKLKCPYSSVHKMVRELKDKELITLEEKFMKKVVLIRIKEQENGN